MKPSAKLEADAAPGFQLGGNIGYLFVFGSWAIALNLACKRRVRFQEARKDSQFEFNLLRVWHASILPHRNSPIFWPRCH
jgi:hypothetical protein